MSCMVAKRWRPGADGEALTTTPTTELPTRSLYLANVSIPHAGIRSKLAQVALRTLNVLSLAIKLVQLHLARYVV